MKKPIDWYRLLSPAERRLMWSVLRESELKALGGANRMMMPGASSDTRYNAKAVTALRKRAVACQELKKRLK